MDEFEYAEKNDNGESYTDANKIEANHQDGVINVKAATCWDLNQAFVNIT